MILQEELVFILIWKITLKILKKTKLYTENVPNSVNKYLYYTFIINGLDESSNVPLQDKDVSNYCQTSGLITKTGILHVLRDEHPLFFNRYEYK
mgnify:CR=1 FL=1